MSARPHQAQKQTQKKTPENGKSNTQITQKHPKHANTQKKRIQHARNAEWQAKLQGIVSTDHTLWSTYKITGGPRTQIPLKKFVLQNSSTGDAYYTDQEKAETLVSAFASVHEKASQISSPLEGLVSADIADHEEEELNRSHPPEQIQISPRLIAHLIRKSPNRKAPGPDNITATQLKNLPSKTIVQIYYIFRACLQISYFPNDWKIAKVHPIPKPGKNKTVLQNYRPISLLSTLSKILEKIILIQLGKHLTQNNIIIPQQYGFREKHSCIHQVLRVAEYITMELNKNRYAQMALLDIEKAFDSVWHDALITKLRRI